MSDNVIAVDVLKSVVQRIVHLETEKDNVQENIKQVYSEAEGNGFDKKTLRKMVKLWIMDTNKRKEEEAITETYKNALGL